MAVTKKQLTPEEVGSVLAQLDAYVVNLKAQWLQQATVPSSWWHLDKAYLENAVQFILASLDKMILFVEDLIPAGTDKKAAVLMMVGKLFDYIVTQAFPLWLVPFAPGIKEVIVGILISNLIDFIVQKYNSGMWSAKDLPNATPSTKFRKA